MILHRLEYRLYGLPAEVVIPAGGQRIRLVDEQHAAEGGLYDLLRFQRRLPDVARHQARTVHLH